MGDNPVLKLHPDVAPSKQLVGSDIHGFCAVADLDFVKITRDSPKRWLRPNEVHAILSNYFLFNVQARPLHRPPKGMVVLFDRTVVRSFRKDGHNWKKKKDSNSVQEAHEKLKVGNEERIHVYYTRGEDDPNFCRRSYWLLDKSLERIVLVHYRDTTEGPPPEVEHADDLLLSSSIHHGLTPVDSSSASGYSRVSGSVVISEEINSSENVIHTENQQTEFTFDEINTLPWNVLLQTPIGEEGGSICSGQKKQSDKRSPLSNMSTSSRSTGSFLPSNGVDAGVSFLGCPIDTFTLDDLLEPDVTNDGYFHALETQPQIFKTTNPDAHSEGFRANGEKSPVIMDVPNNALLSRNSFRKWPDTKDDTSGLTDDPVLPLPSSDGQKSDIQSVTHEQLFNITDISPGWAYSTEKTKILVVGYFYEQWKHLGVMNIYCVSGESCVAAEMVQAGVYRFVAGPHPPGSVNLYLTFDGQTPISQVLRFDYHNAPGILSSSEVTLSDHDDRIPRQGDFKVQMRLAYLLFSSTNKIFDLSSKASRRLFNEARKFASITSPLMYKNWINLLKSASDSVGSQATSIKDLLELVLRNKLQEWLVEKVAEGRKIMGHDAEGQGVIHLCAILGYTWAAHLFSLSGISLDFRDACGWTALHWAAYYGRENMVAALLSAGANPSLVTDPTQLSPGGCTAADLAAKQGHEGLAAYLAEEGLTAHLQAMSLSGNITPVPPTSSNLMNTDNNVNISFTEQELSIKESLAAFRNAVDAASRIESAFRERALKLKTKAVQLAETEGEASAIVAALTIQNAFRNYNRRKSMKAAARIQNHYRTWKERKHFLHMRRQAIKIQAAFRGHQVRKQYRKILWSVGVLEKALLRWRLKGKGLRGIHLEMKEPMRVDSGPESTEEDFFRISRKQAEERYDRSVVRVQALFRSRLAQQEYRRIKLVHEQAKLEFHELSRSK